MLHILLLILKIAGLILAAVLGLLLFLILILLFVPFRYRGFVSRQGDWEGRGNVSWLLSIVRIPLLYEDGKLSVKLKIFGFTVKKFLDREEDREEELAEETEDFFREAEEMERTEERIVRADSPEEGNVRETSEEKSGTEREERVQEPPQVCESSGREEEQEPPEHKKSQVSVFLRIFAKIRDKLCFLWRLPGRISKKIRNLKYTFHRFCVKIKRGIRKIRETKAFLEDERTRKAFHRVLRELKVLLKAAAPRKLRGKLRFGTEDPALTGKILGGISIFYPLFMDNVKVSPDFEQPCLEGELLLKGRIRLITVLGICLRLLMDKNVRYVYRKLA